MPVQWIKNSQEASERSGAFSFEAGDPPLAEVHLWPYRSLSRRGFVAFFAITFALTLIPLSAFIGTRVLWGLLPFVGLAMWGMWALLQRSYRDGEVLEELRIWSDHMLLTRHNTDGTQQIWEANPYWVRPEIVKNGPVENYLILKGGPRDVELGAFLTPTERKSLRRDVIPLLRRAAPGSRHP